MTAAIHTQFRATCPACFKDHAVDGHFMVDHGYECPWHQGGRRGSCSGVGRPHFGTPQGRNVAVGVASGLRSGAKTQRDLAQKVMDGEMAVEERRYVHGDCRYEYAKIESPSEYQKQTYARGFTYRADMMEAAAKSIEERVAAWVETAPRKVSVEKKAPYVHMTDSRDSRLCATMSSRAGCRTSDRVSVTCPRCLLRLQRADERRVAGDRIPS